MILKLKMKLPYTYEFFVTLASDLVKMEEISDEIKNSIKEFNERSRIARNVKQIDSYEVKGDLLFVKLSSNNAMGTPTRGLYLLSQLIMNKLESSKDNEKRGLVDKIIKNRSFFKGVGEVKEIQNSVSLREDEEQTNLERVETKEVEEKDISIESLVKIIEKLEKRVEKLEKVIGKIDYFSNQSNKKELEYMYDEILCNDEDVNEENNEAFDKFDD